MKLVSLQKSIDFSETVIDIPLAAAVECFFLYILSTQFVAQVIWFSEGNSLGER